MNIVKYMRTKLRRLLGQKAKTAWISHPLFLQHEPDTGHPESPKRIAAIEAELERQGIRSVMQAVQASEVADKQLALVHPRKYLRFLESVQPPAGKIYRLDGDTVMSHESLQAARYAAGAVVKAVEMVMKGEAFNAFCAVRPPGHHAHSGKAGGFCLINNVAVGAMHAIANFRLQRIAVVDFDVHHGDGTEEIFGNDPRILFFNSFAQGLYPFPETGRSKERNSVEIEFAPHTGSRMFRKAVREQWLPRLQAFKPELVLLSAGFDAHKQDETGRLNLHEADFAWLTHKIMRAAESAEGRVVSVLEGGYTLESLAASAAAHLYVLAVQGKPECALQYDRHLRHSLSKGRGGGKRV
ncbi:MULTISPECIES: histone deacetylase family protein [unclassified Neisseria]|uniref:histone deacetylase family protein n=1 Tax=unclassified Neisseria TaxID=2623750 RepID=UPI001071917A|nr:MULTISPECIES: histone deacetylase family protein [unclassified Neisseria]MBF0803414.1 histone deacetylase family protein [Neisseria sp. 19428wB4_WF04]TFU43944.1 histone deacetylase family protein [Neisseria sp. WF04]